MENQIYVVMAYKYGYHNSHRYNVGASVSLDRAKALAEAHALDRGGKYACVVTAVADGNDDIGHVKVHYVPSMDEETELKYDPIESAHSFVGMKLGAHILRNKETTMEELINTYNMYAEVEV